MAGGAPGPLNCEVGPLELDQGASPDIIRPRKVRETGCRRSMKQHRRRGPRAERALFWLFISACALWYLKTSVLEPVQGLPRPSDFSHYYKAAHDLIVGANPFRDADYDYPPLPALMVIPLARLKYAAARWVWFLISHACLLYAAILMWRYTGGDRIAACWVAAIWSFAGPAAENLALGQLGPLLLLLLTLTYVRTGAFRGASAGLGFALKFLPGVLAVAFVLRRERRALVAMGAVAGACLAAPWVILAGSMTGPALPAKSSYWMGTPAVLNWSIPAVVLRALDASECRCIPASWIYGNTAGGVNLPRGHAILSVSVSAALLAVCTCVLAKTCRRGLSEAQMPWLFAALTTLSLAASPICWTHYQLLQYPGLAFAGSSFARARATRPAAALVILAALLYAIPVAVLGNYYHRWGGWSAGSLSTLLLWTSTAPLACLGLWFLFLCQLAPSAQKPARSAASC